MFCNVQIKSAKARKKKWKIEKEFLKPVIKSPRECESIVIDPNKLKFKVCIKMYIQVENL